MRLASYRNLLWIAALLGLFCVAAPAQAPAMAVQTSHSAVVNLQISQQPHQDHTGKTNVAEAQPTGASPQPAASQTSQAKSAEAKPAGARIETAGIVPDAAGLLPVAALVGFSFLLGGIVCGTIKKRP